MIRKYVPNFPRLNQTSFTLCTFQYLTFFCVLKLDAPVPQSICQSKYSCPLRVFNTSCDVYGIGYVIFKITHENIMIVSFTRLNLTLPHSGIISIISIASYSIKEKLNQSIFLGNKKQRLPCLRNPCVLEKLRILLFNCFNY